MRLLGQTKAWLRAVLQRRRLEREMQMEMAAHIEQAAARLGAGGMSDRDALQAAHREFGNVAFIQEQARDSRGGRIIGEFISDLRYALRFFPRTPLTSLTIVFTLMLGIGLNAAAYSFMQGYLFNPPPGMSSNSSMIMLVGTERNNGHLQQRSFSYAEMLDYASQSAFSSVAAWTNSSVVLDFGDGADGVVPGTASFVTPNYFGMLGLRLAAGAGFVQTGFDDRKDAELTAVISHAFATSQFGIPSEAIGKKLRVNDALITIVGVAPKRFVGAEPNTGRRVLFMPMSALPTVEHSTNSVFTSADSTRFSGVAQLQSNVSVDQAQPIVRNVAARNLDLRAPDKELTATTTAAMRLRGMIDVSTSTQQAVTVAAFVGALDVVILLVCITTVSSLLVGSAVTRRHEIAVRLALGASRLRLVRQLVTETSLLAIVGAASGLTLYYFLVRATRLVRIPIDVLPTWDTAVFTALFAVTVAMLCGLSPALHATRHGLSDVLKNSSLAATSRSALQRTLVVAQIALAQPLLVVLGMVILSLYKDLRVPPDTTLAERLIIVQFDPFAARNTARSDFAIPALMRRLSGIPGVMGVMSRPNQTSIANAQVVQSDGSMSAAKPLRVVTNFVNADYIDLLSIKLLAGRSFLPTDSGKHVRPLLVRADFAEKAFGGGNPIGRRLCVRSCTDGIDTMEIVGVIAAGWPGVREHENDLQSLALATESDIYALMIRTNAKSEAIIPVIRSISREEAPRLPLTSIATIAELDAKEMETLVQASSATAGAGALTLFLACVGLYAVVALAVGQRKREIGIRIALGAHPNDVVRLFFRGGLRLSVIGLIIGLPLSASAIGIFVSVAGKSDGSMLVMSLIIAAIVLTVASFATWLPARKAAGVDPLTALRTE